ncbi:hypothetical protein L6452_13159 [Arctium lappa]|uniref:Uncharacterized protein n=1 Tax=Arctium lappa TaxID=4217 RepID=A0ACB9CHT9_ARCLA|nr:hypothetical protein L6452_13159 [Arctium lappa]
MASLVQGMPNSRVLIHLVTASSLSFPLLRLCGQIERLHVDSGNNMVLDSCLYTSNGKDNLAFGKWSSISHM